MIIASTHNQPVEIDFIFVFLISKKLYTATLIITIIPPKNVSCEIVSFKNIQTQNGPNENSKSIKNVTSEARRNLVEKINALCTNTINTPPHKKHSKISWIGTLISPRLITKETINTKTQDIRFTGIISIFLDFLKIITNVEKLKAQTNAKIFP